MLANQAHPNAKPFGLTLDGMNTVQLVYHGDTNAVQIFINGTSVVVPRLTPGQLLPIVGKAGFNCSTQVAPSLATLPADTVEWDNFEFTADDSTGLRVLDGPRQWGGHTYYLLSPSGWASAQAAAEQLGGNLVTINSRAEQDWIYSTWGGYDITSLGLPPCSGGGEACSECVINGSTNPTRLDALWIGYHQPEPVNPANEPAGGWVWASGETSAFTFWLAGKPSNTTGCPVVNDPANAAILLGSALAGTGFNPDNTGPWTDFSTYATVATLGVVEVNAPVVNGFHGDWIYSPLGKVNQDPIPAYNGDFVAYHATTGVLMQTLKVGSSTTTGYWGSATFALTGPNQARLYTARKSAAGGSPSVRIEEWDSTGATLASVLLTSLTGGPTSPIGSSVEVGDIRYSIYHGTLFVSVNPHIEGVGTFPPYPRALVYEIDLGLTQVLNTYTGPEIINGKGTVKIALNPNDGTLYVTNPALEARWEVSWPSTPPPGRPASARL